MTLANSSVYLPTVILTCRRSGAGFTNEEPGTGEPDPAQRCVCVLFFSCLPELLFTGYTVFILKFTLCLLVSGGELKSSHAEAGVQSGCAGKVPCTSSCPMC